MRKREKIFICGEKYYLFLNEEFWGMEGGRGVIMR
jgi:hypothetical protein